MPLSKKALRGIIQAQKQAMLPEDVSFRSRQLCQMLLHTPAYQRSHTIYGYLPFNQEADLRPLLQQALTDGKQVALPKCYGRDMRFILVNDLSHIQYSSFGVPEPANDAPEARDWQALVLVPGLVFDRQGYRIGYGGGFYDRFLAQEPEHPTIALCYDFQLVDRLDPEPHDLPVHMVFSV